MTSINNAAKYTYYYLLSLVALVFTAIASGTIVFEIINKYVPDIIEQYGNAYDSSGLRFGISALVIASPIFFFLSRLIQKHLGSGELPKDAFIRKWLTYFIMLVTSVVMIGWLIGTLNSFLDGELTLKFGLKALTALSIAGVIFGFYYYDLKREIIVGQADGFIRLFGSVSLAAVLILFAASVMIVESPAQMRRIKLDNMVIDDFGQLRSAIESYYMDKKSLPDNLDVLKADYNYISDDTLKDPETGKAYGFRKLEAKKFELCAVFRTSNKDKADRFDYTKAEWPHEAGEQCIAQKITYDDQNAKEVIR